MQPDFTTCKGARLPAFPGEVVSCGAAATEVVVRISPFDGVTERGMLIEVCSPCAQGVTLWPPRSAG